jgi:hypothetical protein
LVRACNGLALHDFGNAQVDFGKIVDADGRCKCFFPGRATSAAAVDLFFHSCLLVHAIRAGGSNKRFKLLDIHALHPGAGKSPITWPAWQRASPVGKAQGGDVQERLPPDGPVRAAPA